MKSIKILSIGVLAATFMFTTSCKKKDYLTKPDAQNTYQPKGSYVTNGQNNNIVKTYQIQVFTYDWIDDGNGGWYYDAYPSGIDMSGGVFVYLQASSTAWVAMPITVNDGEFSFAYYTNTKMVELEIASASGTNTFSRPVSTITFKVVTIPSSQMVAHPNVNFKDFRAVKKAFNLSN